MNSSFDRLPMALVTCLLIALAVPVESQVRFGVRAGEYTDLSEPFLGLELLGNDNEDFVVMGGVRF